jgi:hypothetical protein
MLVTARQKAHAVLWHWVLIGRLVAQVHAPTHMIGVVGRTHVNQAVVEEHGAAGLQGKAMISALRRCTSSGAISRYCVPL